MTSALADARLTRLEKQLTHFRLLCLAQWGALICAAWLFVPLHKVQASASDQVLHARGLVIDDAQGRARILLGAPFPTVHDRLRQDSTTAAMVFLDEQGHDRFSIGEKMPGQINGKVPPNFKRMGAGYGLTIYDPIGDERGGMGFLSNGSTVSRAVVALDRPGYDAWGAMVDDKTGFAGTVDLYARELGDGSTGILMGTQGKKAFMTVKSFDDMPRAMFEVGSEQIPSFHLFDKAGKSGPDLLRAASQEVPAKP